MLAVLVGLVAALGSPGSIVVDSTHTSFQVGNESYVWVQHGSVLKATIGAGKDAQLVLEVVRLEGSAPVPPVEVVVALGGEERPLTLRAPATSTRPLDVDPTIRASYAVRHRFPIPPDGGTLLIEVTTPAVPGVGIRLERSLVQPDVTGRLVALDPPASMPQTGSVAGRTNDSATAAAPTEDDLDIPIGDAPPAIEVAVSEGDAPEEPPAIIEVSAHHRSGLGLALPLRLHAQGALGLAPQFGGAISLFGYTGGVRLLAGVRRGLAERFEFGIGIDLDRQSARSTASRASWATENVRVRAELGADLYGFALGPSVIDVGFVLGAGLAAGRHLVGIGARVDEGLLIGPTVRVGPELAIRVGPGAVTAMLPVDWTLDMGPRAERYGPLAASLFLGYRLEL